MIVRSLRFLAAVVILSSAVGAQAQENLPNPWYVGFGTGVAWFERPTFSGVGNISTDTGFNLNGAFGRYIDDIRVIRLEGEVYYARAGVANLDGAPASGDLSSLGLMFNAYYDFRTGTNWTPYLGGGIGYSRLELEDFSSGGTAIDDSDDSFTWQVKAGVTYQFSPTWVLNAGYRYYRYDNVSMTTTAGVPTNASANGIHNAEIGFRFHF